MAKYFESKGIKIISQRGAGPDFHIERKGKVVEVKGSKLKFDRMLRQLWDYAFKFVNVSLALPYDALTLKKAEQLVGLSYLIEEATDKGLTVYLVAPKSDADDFFYVREYKHANFIRHPLEVSNPWELGLKKESLDFTRDMAIEKLIKYSPVENLKREVCEHSSQYVSVVQI